LAALLQERTEFAHSERARRITQVHELTPEQYARWNHDLVELYASFQRFCDQADALSVAHVTHVVHDASVLQSSTGLYNKLRGLLQHREGAAEGVLTFKQLLELLDPIRRQEQTASQEVFEAHCRNTGGLSLLGCQRALRDCVVMPKGETEGQEIEALIQEFDEDGSGEVDRDEFERLVQHVTERLRTLRREAERQRVFEHNWSEEKYREYRLAFITHAEGMSDSLSWARIGEAVEQINNRWPREEVTFTLSELSEPGQTVDILTFFDVMVAMEGYDDSLNIALRAGIEQEAAENLCKEWRRLKPSKEGLVPWRRIKRHVNTMQHFETEVGFTEFIALVTGTSANFAEASLTPAPMASRLRGLFQ